MKQNRCDKRQKDENFEKKILRINKNLKIFYSSYKIKNLNEFKNKKLFALAEIGNPENFFQMIEDNNLIIEKINFPDHYQFSKAEMQNIIEEADKKNCQIIMTEKDFFKVNKFNLDKIKYIKISLEIQNREEFFLRLKRYYDKDY